MAASDDLHTAPPAGMLEDLATLRVTPPTPSEISDDLAAIRVEKPVASPTQIAKEAVSVMGANPDSPVPLEFGRRIAKGGMGAILEGSDCKLGRKIAVKVMLDADASADQKQRFVQEAAVLGRLEHPNIVPIHDLGRDSEGALYYTMKLVKGETLQDIIDRLRKEDVATLEHYTLDRLLTIFRKVCDALAFAHAQNIIHRDLKPENIMVGEFGEVLVMDWGIAKVLGDSNDETRMRNDELKAYPSSFAIPDSSFRASTATAAQTLDGAVMGTPNYMSPEQAMGKVNELDERSDIFSLGGILYAILTLRPPVEGKDVWEVLEKVQMGNITSPTMFGASTTGKGKPKPQGEVLEAKKITPLPHVPGGRVPPALSAVAMKALTLDKAKRYQHVAAFSADIEAFQGGFATSAEGAGVTTQLVLLIKRNKGIFATATAAWLLIMGLAVWFVIGLKAKEERATQAEAVAVKKEAETSKALARSALSLAEAALREGNGPAMQGALNEVPENLRDSTWRYLLSQSDTSIARIDVGAEVDDVAAHPRLPSVFAVVDQRGKVTILNVRTGERLREFTAGFSTQGKQCLHCLAFSPDGERLAVGRGNSVGDLVIHEARVGNRILELKTLENLILLFSPDGRWLLRGGRELQDIGVVDAQNGQPRWTRDASKHVLSATFTPDGGQVLLQAADTELWSSTDGSLARAVANHGALAAALRPDGQLCVTGDRNGTIRGIELSDGRAVFEFRTDDRPIDHLAFTANGKLFASTTVMADGRQMVRLWDARTGAPVQSLLGGSGKVRGISVHPLSSELVVCGPETRAWSLGGDARWSLDGGSAQCAFWGEDDMMIAPARESGSALVRLQERSATTLWTFPLTGYREKDVSADGRFAVFGGKLTKSPFVLLRRNGQKVEEVIHFTTPGQMLQRLRLSPSGASVAAIEGLNAWVEVFDSSTGKKRVTLPTKDIKRFWEVRWLSENELVGLVTAKAERGTAGSEEWVVRWNAMTGKVLQTATTPSTLDVLTVAPDGLRFAEAGADKKVRIRDAATLAVLQEFRAHDGPITALTWHPRKPILASGSSDLAIRLWNLETGERIDELRGPLAAPHTLAFAPSGQRLGCASLDATTSIWDPPSLRDDTAAPLKAASGPIYERVWFKEALPDHPAAHQLPERPKAALPTDADGWEDQLASLTPAEVEKTGHGWSLKDGELFCPDTKWTMFPLLGDFSNTSYRMRVRLRRTGKRESFTLLLPTAAWKCGFAIDGAGGNYTGILMVNGKFAEDIPGVVEGQQVNDTEPHDLEVIVRLDDTKPSTTATITATLDSRPLYKWTGPTAALSQDRRWPPIDRRFLALGTNGGGWAVSEVKVKRLEK